MARGVSFSDAAREVVQAMMDLARAEFSALTADLGEQARQGLRVGVLLGIASVLVFWAVGLLLAGGVLALAIWLDPWIAAAVLGGILLLAAGVLLWWAKQRAQRLETPAKLTMQHLGESAAWWEREFGSPSGPAAPPSASARPPHEPLASSVGPAETAPAASSAGPSGGREDPSGRREDSVEDRP